MLNQVSSFSSSETPRTDDSLESLLAQLNRLLDTRQLAVGKPGSFDFIPALDEYIATVQWQIDKAKVTGET